MKFSDLYACSKCGLVYVNRPGGPLCEGGFGGCRGIIRPINYKPPTKDPRQRDIDEAIREEEQHWLREARAKVCTVQCPSNITAREGQYRCDKEAGHTGNHRYARGGEDHEYLEWP